MRKGKYMKEDWGDGLMIAQGLGATGQIIMLKDGNHGLKKWHALESPFSSLSRLMSGVKCKVLKGMLQDDKGKPSAFAVIATIAILCRSKVKGDDYARIVKKSFIDAYFRMTGANYELILEELRMDEEEFIDSDYFKDELSGIISLAFDKAGGEGVATMGKALKLIESGFRSLTPEEQFLLEAIQTAAEKANDVPTRKEVLAEWFCSQLSTEERTFDKMRKRLGFSWLPADSKKKVSR